ncbi:hypothetical protein [Oceaniradius stylonematis]|uniref:hypothetical protein n=1 Tax=Oceaniradius stylonematis TaxID=2184161 RepID=UPI00273E5217|nr:hypothetical protein [Oceaniradius stylonematis]
MARQPATERTEPRISVNDLALFMVSSETARIGIIRRAKFPQAPPIIRYRDARRSICAYLADQNRSVNHLLVVEDTLRQRIDDPSTSPLMRDDAAHSIDVLHAVQGMQNRLAGYDFRVAPTQQAPLHLGGVTVSVRADLLVHGASRGVEQIGSALLRMTMDDADSEVARDRRRNMGLYAATLARLHTDQNITTNRDPANRLCMSIDIQHGEVFVAPNSNTRRTNDLGSACQMIAAIWPTITNSN